MSKSKKVEHYLGNVAAFIADSDAIASDFVGIINAETSGKVLELTKTHDGYWISIDDGHPKVASLVIDLGRETPGIKVACVIPSKEKLVGGEVLEAEGGFPDGRSLIQLILGLPATKQLREVTIWCNVPDLGEHVETESKEYQDYYDVNGPHIQACRRLDELLRKADVGFVEEWEWIDGSSYEIVAKGVDEMVLKETILKALDENDHGLLDIEVFTQTEMDLYWAESDALVAKARAEWDAKPQEEKDRIEKERQEFDVDAALAQIRKRYAELKAAE